MERTTREAHKPVIVVGGGLAGLMCVARLARAGVAVELLESAPELGGRARTSERDGYLFNRGPHALYRSSERLLRSVGVHVSGGHPAVTGSQLLEGGELFGFGPDALARRGGLSAGERASFLRAMSSVATARGGRRPGDSAAEWSERHGRTRRVRNLLSALLRLATYAGDLERVPAELALEVLREGTVHPVRYVDGGWRTIVQALAVSARAAGAQLQTDTRVDSVRTGAVRLGDGRERAARAVVLAGLSPARARRLLGAAPDELAAGSRPVHAACLDVALERLPEPRNTFVLSVDDRSYFSVHSRCSRVAADGHALVHVLRYEDGSQPEDELVREQLRTLLERLQPGWRSHLVHERFAPRMVVAHDLPAPGAGLAGRSGAGDCGVPGVLLAGDWIGPRGWIAGASLASGAEAAHRILAGEGAGTSREAATALA